MGVLLHAGSRPWGRLRAARVVVSAGVLLAMTGCAGTLGGGADSVRLGRGDDHPLRILVMDPLADRMACDCVKGYAQRRYDELGAFLGGRLGCSVAVDYAESLVRYLEGDPPRPDVIIGKQSMILADAGRAKLPVRAIAELTDKRGHTTLTGLFVVRSDDASRSIGDLQKHRLLFGPADADEKHGAAMAALRMHGIAIPADRLTSPGCNIAALAVVDREADAAVISSYAYPLLIGCDTIERGALRVIGETAPVPFITVFVTKGVTETEASAIREALHAVRHHAGLLNRMESRFGFLPVMPVEVPVPKEPPAEDESRAPPPQTRGWTDWRGPDRDGFTPDVPEHLPAEPHFLWRVPMTGPGLAGIAATSECVIVPDKDAAAEHDLFRCLDAKTGKARWTLRYAAPGEMDYSNAPRANPVIHGGRVYTLGAMGHLHCVDFATGNVMWKTNIIKAFGAELPTWGTCGAPLLVDGMLIVNPGAKDASLVALDAKTGEVRWTSPGQPPAYSSFIIGTFGGKRQIVGYDTDSLGGWDPASGRRLWKLVPPESGDFNVPTPVDLDGRLLVSTENNGTRLYAFNDDGTIKPEPVAHHEDLNPDCSTPVVVDGIVIGSSVDLFGLSIADGLAPAWTIEDDLFEEYASFIAGDGRALVTTCAGELLLVRAGRESPEPVERLRVFEKADIWAHPALVGDRLYIRTQQETVCLLLAPPRTASR